MAVAVAAATAKATTVIATGTALETLLVVGMLTTTFLQKIAVLQQQKQ